MTSMVLMRRQVMRSRRKRVGMYGVEDYMRALNKHDRDEAIVRLWGSVLSLG